jgi:hypothetical protein
VISRRIGRIGTEALGKIALEPRSRFDGMSSVRCVGCSVADFVQNHVSSSTQLREASPVN